MADNETDYFTHLTNVYLKLWENRDHRVDDWLLMSSIRPVFICLVAYISLVYFGPKLMKNRRPFNMKMPMIVYNNGITILNLLITAQFMIAAIRYEYSWSCEVEQSEVEAMRIATATHLMFVSKLIEWFDTVVFILRKKENQLTFLHVYHHVAVFFIGWFNTRFIPSEDNFLMSMLNSGTHVVMYSYYTVAAFGPVVQKYLWWKKYLTTLQMIQFIAEIVIEGVVIMKGCSSHQWIHWLIVTFLLSLLYLFITFYQKTYKTKAAKKD